MLAFLGHAQATTGVTIMFQIRIIICLLTLLNSAVYAAGAESDSLTFRNFEAGSYQATSINYTGTIDERGIAFFANESGVLEYDGSVWTLIPVKNFSPAIALHVVGSRIYVGGRNEFGYLQLDSLGAYEYVSLRDLLTLKKEETLTNIWQIEQVGEDIYFESMEMILRFDGETVHKIPLKGAYIFKIGEQLFASAKKKKGLAKITKDSVQFVNRQFSFEKDMGFGSMKGLQGETLVFTAEKGIFEIDTLTYKTKKWEVPANDFISKNSLYYGLALNDSVYAFATYLGGLVLVDREGAIIKNYTKDNGLVSKHLREMFFDQRGNLWLTSDYGLSYAMPATDSLQEEQPQTLIRKVSLQDKEVYLHGQPFHLQTEKDYGGSVVFHFATPGYHKEELEYSFFLEGFDEKWSLWRGDIKKEYTNLPHGNYTFQLKARVKEGFESSPVTASLLIPAPWYKTTSAYFIGALLFSTLIISAVHYRTKRLKLLNKRLAKIINNRTKELVEQREQLRAANNELRIKNIELDNFVYRSSHDLVAPLKSLKGLIHISRMEKEAANQLNYFNLMLTSVDKLESFIKSIMEYSSNTKKGVLRQELDLDEILDSIIEDLKYYEKAERIEIKRNIQQDTRFKSDPKRLKIVLSNLITNSIKYHNYYQDGLFIEIKAEQVDEQIFRIQITDNGRGIEPEYLDKIFDMFFRASSTAEGSGLGLYIVKDTVKKLGGEISVSSDYGKGTTFSLLFPLSEPKSASTAE